MKTILSTAILSLSMIFGTSAMTDPIKKEVKVKESKITWIGKKVTGQHNGTIELKEGTLIMDGDQLTGGSFVIDMTTIQVTDLKAGKGKEKLEGHLNSDDFFGVDNYATATYTIDSAVKNGDTYTVDGSLTIKGKSLPHQIKLTKMGNTLTTNVEIDRTKYGIVYKSGSIFDGLKDAAINDDFELAIRMKI
ncbi:MAG: YceI family protein [Dokdonia sp.]|jgi:polyisoprenoid-binding protein YceI|nr:lipid-binding protein [Cytophagaceae bacterium]